MMRPTLLLTRVGICPFNVNKCDVTETLLPHGAAEISFHSAHRTDRMNDRSAEHNVAGITPRICNPLENTGQIYQIVHSRALHPRIS